MLIPVVAIALTGEGWAELAVVIVAAAVACIVPVLIEGPVTFDSLRGPLVAIALATGIGIATRLLVAAVREQAAAAQRDRLAVERVGEVVYGLFASRDVRADLCGASLQVGYAEIAVLFEPTSDGDVRVTAQAGADPGIVGTALGPDDRSPRCCGRAGSISRTRSWPTGSAPRARWSCGSAPGARTRSCISRCCEAPSPSGC